MNLCPSKMNILMMAEKSSVLSLLPDSASTDEEFAASTKASEVSPTNGATNSFRNKECAPVTEANKRESGAKRSRPQKPRAKKAKKSKKRTWKKVEGRPKRPLSAYNVFFRAERERMISTLANDNGTKQSHKKRGDSQSHLMTAKHVHRSSHGKIGFSNMAKTVASKWKSLPSEQLKMYEAQAFSDKLRFNQEMRRWKLEQKLHQLEQKKREMEDEIAKLKQEQEDLDMLGKNESDQCTEMNSTDLLEQDMQEDDQKTISDQSVSSANSTGETEEVFESPVGDRLPMVQSPDTYAFSFEPLPLPPDFLVGVHSPSSPFRDVESFEQSDPSVNMQDDSSCLRELAEIFMQQ